ncbi:170_t:CDS:1 [Entrophospora sp. SA101]|nr:170_t:CDS:1 [Entrophospora sp. SA101]
MAQKILEALTQLLKKDERLVVDGKLAKNKIIELALQLDLRLLKLLKSSPEIKKIFFQEVDDILVFDKIKLQSFISNKQFLPDSFTAYKNKIGLSSDRQYLTDSGEVVLV